MARVTIRYYGGAAAAAGTQQETADAETISDLRQALRTAHGAGLSRVLDVASLLVDGQAARSPALVLVDGQTVDVLPPFAGG